MWWWGPCAASAICADVRPFRETRAHVYDELRPLMLERTSCSTAANAFEATAGRASLQASSSSPPLPGLYTARDRNTHELVALKVFRKRLLARPETRRRLRREVRILTLCRDEPHLLTLYGVYSTRTTVEIAFELARGGEVLSRLLTSSPPPSPLASSPLADTALHVSPAHATPRYTFREREVSRIAASVVSGLQFLHRHQIVHAEVRPEHILYSSTEPDARVVLADFGRAAYWHLPNEELSLECRDSRQAGQSRRSEQSERSTKRLYLWDDAHHARFLPPFVQQRRSLNAITTWTEAQQLDTFALGVTLYVLLCASFPPPFDDGSNTLTFPHSTTFSISRAARDLLERLLVVDPVAGLSMDAISSHPWIADTVASAAAWPVERLAAHRAFAMQYAADVAAHARRRRVSPATFAHSLEDRLQQTTNGKEEEEEVDGDDESERPSFVSTATGDAQQQQQPRLTIDDDADSPSADAFMRLASDAIDACAVRRSDAVEDMKTGDSAESAPLAPVPRDDSSRLWRVLTKQRRFFSFRSASSSGDGSTAKSDSDV